MDFDLAILCGRWLIGDVARNSWRARHPMRFTTTQRETTSRTSRKAVNVANLLSCGHRIDIGLMQITTMLVTPTGFQSRVHLIVYEHSARNPFECQLCSRVGAIRHVK